MARSVQLQLRTVDILKHLIRLVSFSLLWFHMGRGDISSLFCPGEHQTISRYGGRNWPHWQSQSCGIFRGHLYWLRPPTICSKLARERETRIHASPSTKSRKGHQDVKRCQTGSAHRLDVEPSYIRRRHVSHPVRTLFTLCHNFNLYLRNVSSLPLSFPFILPQFTLTPVLLNFSPWAFACWAPFAFIGIEINRLTSSPLSPYRSASASATYFPVPSSHAIDIDSPPSSPTLLRLNHLDRDIDSPASSSSTGETAGIYLGILNLFATLPQFLGTFISMVVFTVLEPEKKGEGGAGLVKQEGVNAISVCLFIGAMSSVGAAWATRRFGFVR